LPPFWSNSPANWFRSVEALFALRHITDPLVLTSLSETQVDLVNNMVEEEPDNTSYAKMKAALFVNNTLMLYQMVDRLMAMEPLGGQKAIELLVAMQKLRPPSDDQFFAWAFLQQLPQEVRVLLAHEDHADVRKLAEKADGLLALHQPQSHELTAVAAATAAATPEDDFQDPLCYFHVRYGDKAHRCEEPCAWLGGN
jgi:hypothetical protein